MTNGQNQVNLELIRHKHGGRRGQPIIADAARSPHYGSPMQGSSTGSLYRAFVIKVHIGDVR